VNAFKVNAEVVVAGITGWVLRLAFAGSFAVAG
jgi:hypothetical protein